jgi:hypothetical protein
MTGEEMEAIKLSGAWKSGKGETFPILLHVGDFRIGWDVWAEGTMEVKAHIKARVVKMIENSGFPKRIEMVMPKTGYVLLIDSLFTMGSAKTLAIEATGYLYGKAPLEDEPREGATLQKSITTATMTDGVQVTPFTVPYIAPPQQIPSQPWGQPNVGGGWNTGDIIWQGTSQSTVKLGDHEVNVIEAPWLPPDQIMVMSDESAHAISEAWDGMVQTYFAAERP